jgi:hypothetical protein
MQRLLFLPILLCFPLAGCGEDRAHDHSHAHGHSHAEPSADPGAGQHHHEAPHGGTLLVLGDEFAHVELVLDPTGKLTAYLLDGSAQRGVRSAQKEISLTVSSGNTKVLANLQAVANVLTGETGGDTSEFSVQLDELAGLDSFTGEFQSLEIKGQTFSSFQFQFPEGNESRAGEGAHEEP